MAGEPTQDELNAKELDELFSFGLPSSAEDEDEAADAAAPESASESATEEADTSDVAETAADADSSDDTIPEKQTADVQPKGKEASPPAPTTPDPLAELRAQNAELQKQLSQLTTALTGMQAKAAEAQAPKQAPAAAPEADYQVNLAMPPELVSMLESEDPAEKAQGYGLLASGSATAAVAKVHEMLKPVFQQLPTLIERVISQQHERKTVEGDFYGKFPQLNKPQIRPLVQQTALQVMRERNAQAWSNEVRDEVGKRVVEMLMGALPPEAIQPPANPPARTPPPPTPRGSSPARVNAPTNGQQQYIDSLFN